jgi:hypothetical protein
LGSNDRGYADYRHIGYCDAHDKNRYASRKAAKRAAKMRNPGERKTAYRCTVYPGNWHYGSLNYSRDTYRGIEPFPGEAGALEHERAREHREPPTPEGVASG